MQTSSTIVNVNPTHIHELIGFISQTIGVPLEVPADVSTFTAILVEHGDALISGAEDSDAEGCFMVLFKDIQLCEDVGVTTKLVRSITTAIAGKIDDPHKPHLRLRIMANL
jgi:hypothetical protein